MAGDWIKMRVALDRDPRVVEMANLLAEDGGFIGWLGDPVRRSFDHAYDHVTPRVTRDIVVTSLLRVWGVAVERGKREGDDCLLSYCSEFTLDEISDTPGFGPAMVAVGWAMPEDNGRMRFPNFLQENVLLAERGDDKRKTQSRESSRRHRQRQRENVTRENVTRDITRDQKVTPRGEERRGEEILDLDLGNLDLTSLQWSEVRKAANDLCSKVPRLVSVGSKQERQDRSLIAKVCALAQLGVFSAADLDAAAAAAAAAKGRPAAMLNATLRNRLEKRGGKLTAILAQIDVSPELLNGKEAT